MTRLLYPALALALVASCSPRQNRNTATVDTTPGAAGETGMTADTARPSAATDTANAPAAMLSELNVANTMEIQLAKTAQQKAKSPAVKKLAAKLQADHTKNRAELQAVAKKLNVTVTPSAGGAAADTAMPADLSGKTGSDFDKAYIEHEIQDHQSNIDKLQSQMIPAATDPQVKSYLQKTLSSMQAHLTSLQQVQKQLGTS